MDTLSIRPNILQPRPDRDEENEEQIEQGRVRDIAARQRMFAERAGKQPKTWTANPNMRRRNLQKEGAVSGQKTGLKSFTLVYGVAIFWDIAGFLVGLIPVVGWIVNLCVIVPVAIFNLYIMCTGRGVKSDEFWAAFKYIFGEAIPYVNVIPFYTRSIFLIANPKVNKVIHTAPPGV